MSCAQLLRRADELKAKIIEGNAETWVTRQTLLDLYQQVLITNLEFALDKKVEQDLWNHVFKNQINILQRKVKDKVNPKRTELQATLTLFLDSASGFYLQLLQELCSAFDLKLACRVTSAKLGILDDKNPKHKKLKQAQHASCLYICQYCLVHLGDLSRYRSETNQAESYYRHAAKLVPSSGQPYNQLAIVAASRGDQLAMTFFYVRSTAVRHPFPAASTNLQSTFAKLVDKDEVKLFKMKLIELIHFFTKFHAVIHLTVGDADLQVASMIRDKLEENLRSHLAQESLSAKQLVQMMAINLFTLHHIKHLDKELVTGADGDKDAEEVVISDDHFTADEIQSWNLTLNLTVTLFQLMLHYMPSKSQEKARQWVCLPAIRVFLDWLIHRPSIFEDDVVVSKPIVWSKLAKVLTFIQYKDSADVLPSNQALWEDVEVDQFLPLQKAHSILNFDEFNQVKLNPDMESRERVCRLVQHGKWLVENQPSLMKSERAETSSKLIFTCALSEEQVRKQQQRSKQQKLLPSKPKPENKIQTHTNLKTALKKGREGPPRKVEFVGIEEIIHDDRRSENKRPESKSQSIAVQAILPRKKTSSESDSSITPIGSPQSISGRQPVGVFHEQNPIQSPVSKWEPEAPTQFHSGPKSHANPMHNIQSWHGSNNAGSNNNTNPYQNFNSSGHGPQGQYQNPRDRHSQPHMQDQGIGPHGMPGSPVGNWSSPQRSPSQNNPPGPNYPGGLQAPSYPQPSQENNNKNKENNPMPGRMPPRNWNKGLPWPVGQHRGIGRPSNQWSNPPGDGHQHYQQAPKIDWQPRFQGPLNPHGMLPQPQSPQEMYNTRTTPSFHRPGESPNQQNSPTSSQPNIHQSRSMNNPSCAPSHPGEFPIRARQSSPQSPQSMSMQNQQGVLLNHPRAGTPTKSPQTMEGFIFPTAAELNSMRNFNPVNMERQPNQGFNQFDCRNSRMPPSNTQSNSATMQALTEEVLMGMSELSKSSKLLGYNPNGPFSPDFNQQGQNVHLRQGTYGDLLNAIEQEVNYSDERGPFPPPVGNAYRYGYQMNNDGTQNMPPTLVTSDDGMPSSRQTPSPAVSNQRLAINLTGLDIKNTSNRGHGFNNIGSGKTGFFDENSRSTGGYTLFNRSPWNAVQGDNLGLPSSPFVSQPTSPNATPRSQSPIHQGTLGLGENLPGLGLSWRDERANNVWGPHQLSSSPTSSLLPERLQSIWSSPIGSSSEPSPLEMLLRQQQQKQHHHDT